MPPFRRALSTASRPGCRRPRNLCAGPGERRCGDAICHSRRYRQCRLDMRGNADLLADSEVEREVQFDRHGRIGDRCRDRQEHAAFVDIADAIAVVMALAAAGSSPRPPRDSPIPRNRSRAESRPRPASASRSTSPAPSMISIPAARWPSAPMPPETRRTRACSPSAHGPKPGWAAAAGCRLSAANAVKRNRRDRIIAGTIVREAGRSERIGMHGGFICS